MVKGIYGKECLTGCGQLGISLACFRSFLTGPSKTSFFLLVCTTESWFLWYLEAEELFAVASLVLPGHYKAHAKASMEMS